MGRLTQSDYRHMLAALAPPGAALPRDPGSRWQALLDALAAEFARVDGRGHDLLREMLPEEADELLPDWEATAGLPDDCVEGDQTTSARRRSLLRLLTGTGGQSRRYFESLAASLGYDVAVSSFHPHTVEDDVGASIHGAAWRWAWEVRSEEQTVEYHDVNGTVRDALANWGNDRLECVIRRYQPAESVVLFAYGE